MHMLKNCYMSSTAKHAFPCVLPSKVPQEQPWLLPCGSKAWHVWLHVCLQMPHFSAMIQFQITDNLDNTVTRDIYISPRQKINPFQLRKFPLDFATLPAHQSWKSSWVCVLYVCPCVFLQDLHPSQLLNRHLSVALSSLWELADK